MEKKIPYFARGLRTVATDSSVLVSSSKYLNNAKMREWVSTHLLRRNGADRPTPSDNIELKAALNEIRDPDHVEELFEIERKKNPKLDRWLSERFVSTFALDELKHLGPQTVGGIFYDFMSKSGFDYNIDANLSPKSHYDYYFTRFLQTHDLEHILCGGSFDLIGEVLVYWVNLTNYFEHIEPELASELANKLLLGCSRFMMRSMLHYPGSWHTMTKGIMHGMRIGVASEPILMMRYEDIFPLSLEEARAALGIRDVGPPIDTKAAAALMIEPANT